MIGSWTISVIIFVIGHAASADEVKKLNISSITATKGHGIRLDSLRDEDLFTGGRVINSDANQNNVEIQLELEKTSTHGAALLISKVVLSYKYVVDGTVPWAGPKNNCVRSGAALNECAERDIRGIEVSVWLAGTDQEMYNCGTLEPVLGSKKVDQTYTFNCVGVNGDSIRLTKEGDYMALQEIRVFGTDHGVRHCLTRPIFAYDCNCLAMIGSDKYDCKNHFAAQGLGMTPSTRPWRDCREAALKCSSKMLGKKQLKICKKSSLDEVDEKCICDGNTCHEENPAVRRTTYCCRAVHYCQQYKGQC